MTAAPSRLASPQPMRPTERGVRARRKPARPLCGERTMVSGFLVLLS